jgi:hypothetical protein
MGSGWQRLKLASGAFARLQEARASHSQSSTRLRSLVGGTLGSLRDTRATPDRHWEDRKEHLLERVWYPHAPVEHLEDPDADTSWPWTQWPEVREAVRPEIAEMALAASFLASEGLALTPDASTLFVDAVSQRLFSALALLEQRAKGDYSRDTYPDTFPAYVDQRRGASTGMSCWDLFGAYVAARKPAATTVNRWRVAQGRDVPWPLFGALVPIELTCGLTHPRGGALDQLAAIRVHGWAFAVDPPLSFDRSPAVTGSARRRSPLPMLWPRRLLHLGSSNTA